MEPGADPVLRQSDQAEQEVGKALAIELTQLPPWLSTSQAWFQTGGTRGSENMQSIRRLTEIQSLSMPYLQGWCKGGTRNVSQALSLSSNLVPSRLMHQKCQCLLGRARNLNLLGKLEEARNKLYEVLRSQPNKTASGVLRRPPRRAGKHKEAIERLERIQNLETYFPAAL